MTTRMEDVKDFLAHKRLALVGASHEEGEFSRMVMRELLQRGYDVVPVNPSADTIEDRACFARVSDVEPPVDGALLMTRREVTPTVVDECLEAGISRIWMHRGAGPGAVDQEAAERARARGARVIDGQCPLMFLPDAGFGHRLHGFGRKLVGAYPR